MATQDKNIDELTTETTNQLKNVTINDSKTEGEPKALTISELSTGEEENKLTAEDGSPIGFIDPTNFNVKHPLQNKWTLWFDNPSNSQGRVDQKSWADQLKKVVTFDTVEDFWRIFNYIRPASKLQIGANYHLFKNDIEPKWEHPENYKGGKWNVGLKGNLETLDKMWLWAVLACIGENFEDENEICGCVVSIRKGQQNRLAVWTKTAASESAQKRIGTQLRKVLELAENISVSYTVHADALKKNSSYNNKPKYEA